MLRRGLVLSSPLTPHVFLPPHRMLPYSLCAALVSAVSGQVVTKTGRWRPVMWFSWVVIVLGYGLMIQLDEASNKCVIAIPG